MMQDNIMDRAPEIGKLVAEVIAQWSEIEYLQGALLAYIIHTEPHTAVAMYLSLKAAHAREALLDSAAKTKLSVREYDIFSAVMAHTRSVAAQRNKLAHWCWATSPDIPENTLLLVDPESKIHSDAGFLSRPATLDRHDPEDVLFVTKEDVARIVRDVIQARNYLGRLSGIVWSENTPSQRAEFRQSLSSEPAIRQFLENLEIARAKKTPEFP
jgi:hypothetical protein